MDPGDLEVRVVVQVVRYTDRGKKLVRMSRDIPATAPTPYAVSVAAETALAQCICHLAATTVRRSERMKRTMKTLRAAAAALAVVALAGCQSPKVVPTAKLDGPPLPPLPPKTAVHRQMAPLSASVTPAPPPGRLQVHQTSVTLDGPPSTETELYPLVVQTWTVSDGRQWRLLRFSPLPFGKEVQLQTQNPGGPWQPFNEPRRVKEGETVNGIVVHTILDERKWRISVSP